METIIAVLVGLIVGSVFFFIGAVLPIWAVIDCAISDTRSNKSKIIWIVVIMLAWSLGAIIYGVFSAEKRPMKIVSTISGIVVSLMVVALLAIMHFTSASVIASLKEHEAELGTPAVNTATLSDTEVDNLKKALADIRVRAETSIFTLKDTGDVVDGYEAIVKDKVVDKTEYTQWYASYKSASVPPKAVSE